MIYYTTNYVSFYSLSLSLSLSLNVRYIEYINYLWSDFYIYLHKNMKIIYKIFKYLNT